MRITPARRVLWRDAYASCYRQTLDPEGTRTTTDPNAVLLVCRGRAEVWLQLREAGVPAQPNDPLARRTADALGLPDCKPSTIRNFLRGL